jgi:hypothetical protein
VIGVGTGRLRLLLVVGAAVALALGVVGCGASEPAPAGGPAGPTGAQPAGLPPDCSVRVTDVVALRSALRSVAPGGRVCAVGDLRGSRLEVFRSGTAQQPIEVIGDGRTAVDGVTIKADHVVVKGFSVIDGKAPGIWMKGTDITVENNTVRHPIGDDYDGLRFFGDDLKIVHNTIGDISPDSTDAHADCMQSFATGPKSRTPNSGNVNRVLIDGNRCERIDNQCLIVEGPFSSAGDGSGIGRSSDITFSNNYCDAHASQAVWMDDVRNVTLKNNDVQRGVQKAFALTNNSVGATVSGNKIAPQIENEISMDDTSEIDYHGPTPQGSP